MNSFNLTEWALKHRAVVLFLILVIAIAGALGFSRIGQLEDPKFSVPSMTAMVMWPGATAQQIQDEVLNRMEKKFEQLDHFEKVVTFARQGFGGMTISVKGGTSNADQQEAWYQARKKLEDIRRELPEGVVGPVFNDEYGDVYGLMYAVKGDGIGQAELSDISEDVKRRLLKVPMVKKVDVLGKQAERVFVEFSHERLAALGITPELIIESLKSQNAMLPAGSIDTRGDRVMVRVSGQFTSIDDIRNVPIAADGRVIRLGDFTTIERGFEDPPSYTIRHNGQQVLMLGIVMTDDGNVVELGKGLDGAIGQIQSELPYGAELERVADQPTTVKEAVWDFERSLLEALIIVVIVSLLSLGWRTGIVVALSVPLVLGVVAIVMLAMGWNLERVSLGSLIIALGLLVDDSIIAVEMMVVKMEAGWDRIKAAAFSYSATAVPRLTGALITVAAFMPIGFSKSSTGEYAGGIFWIVGTAVLVSWLVSGLFTPYLAVKMLPQDLGKHHGGSDPYDTPFYRRLRGWIDRAIERRWMIIGATAGALVLALAGLKLVPQQFFPNSTRPELIVDLRVKEGASFAATAEQVKRMESGALQGQGCALLHRVHGRGRTALLSIAQPRVAEPGLCAIHRHDAGSRGAGARALAPDGHGRRKIPGDLGAGHAPGARTAGRFPRAVPRRRRRYPGRSLDSARRRTRRERESEGPRRAARLERSGPHAADRPRPGKGARARTDSRGSLCRDADVDERSAALAASRGRGARRHRRARGSLGTTGPRDTRERQRVHAPGHGRAAVADCHRALRARRASPLAPQSRHGDHGSC